MGADIEKIVKKKIQLEEENKELKEKIKDLEHKVKYRDLKLETDKKIFEEMRRLLPIRVGYRQKKRWR